MSVGAELGGINEIKREAEPPSFYSASRYGFSAEAREDREVYELR